MLDLDKIDLKEIAEALASQTDYDSYTLLEPKTAGTLFWTREGGIDGRHPVDLDDLVYERDLTVIRPLPSHIWYADMADFASGISDQRASRRLERALDGSRPFRRFKDELQDEYPDLLEAWYEFRDARAARRAVEWLAEESLIDEDAADRYLAKHPEPDLP